MAKVDGAIITAEVSEVAVPGQPNDTGGIDARLICGAQHLILTLSLEDARQFAEGLLHAVKLAEKAQA